MKSYSYIVLLFIFWILLSGHLEPLLLVLGAASIALTAFLAQRMNVIDHESYPIHLTTKFPGFYLYLLKKILIANYNVVRRILGWRGAKISPQLIEIPQPLASDLAAVMYANSITLTPGTVTIGFSKEKLTIHALSDAAAEDIGSGEMAEEISKREFN
ncbi:Na+/H+ antiporter subunit E [Simiduia agarivorans]|uniref:Cation antiporter n=1 Tax=Simiduia agarivorans (strain DSM 21679 / JCM 13881 / BCRC 17597 / SA1) TaxID=1117647 RepID=K4KPL6_SIMAS|nr:Na+/H+ antiporter subunit E [Simiduia agarivorans]AFV00992.1 cation antiporter [Simiduia agarivorans SA1 = DSM 21679]